jgi:hypothetical protein
MNIIKRIEIESEQTVASHVRMYRDVDYSFGIDSLSRILKSPNKTLHYQFGQGKMGFALL